MKRVLIVSLALAFLAACNNDSETSTTEEKKDSTAAPVVTDITQNPDYQKGLELVGKSDCFTCHAIEDKIQGPAYKDVAAKYAGMPDTIISHLANKVIAGGSGVWGEIPMIPHPNLSKEDAETMVKYILLQKK